MSTPSSLEHAQVLITGGGSGIGRGLALRYLVAGARVCITGRNRERLEHAVRELPGLSFIVSDIADPQAREHLAMQVRQTLPQLTVLINNAGIQRRVSLAADDEPWSSRQTEIDTLLSGPVHLTQLLIPHILEHGSPAMIVNVTSGGAYVPQPFAPLYSACKAALHSYTVNLRHALQHTGCRVVEVIPPAINTQLSGTLQGHGADIDTFCDTLFARLSEAPPYEIDFGATSSDEFRALRNNAQALFDRLSGRFVVQLFDAERKT